MSIVSRVTIIRGNGARAAGAPRDHESCELRSDDVRRCGQLCLPTTRARAALPPGAPETVQNQRRRTGGDLVQLITPAGERVSHPEFDPWVQDVSDEQLGSLYEDMVVIRRIDAEATALQRQGELALWPPLLGQEASQIGSARALRDDDFVFPSYRDNGVAYCRGVKPEDIVRAWRGNAFAGWDPYTVNVATPADHHRRADPARHRLRHGHPERRRRLGRRGLLRRRRHERRRRQRGHGLRRELPGAGGLLLPEQPLGHLRARPAAVPHPARGPRLRLRHPQHAGGRQRCPRRHGRHPHRPGPCPPRRRPHLHRGRHLPDGPAHDGG